jgi:hypothetical protein
MCWYEYVWSYMCVGIGAQFFVFVGCLSPSMGRLGSVTRYRSAISEELIVQLEEACNEVTFCAQGLLSKVTTQLRETRDSLTSVIGAVAELDCLISLAIASGAHPVSCRPQFVIAPKAFLKVKEMVHPYMRPARGQSVVPNTVELGTGPGENVVLLTGPNMGGKSSLAYVSHVVSCRPLLSTVVVVCVCVCVCVNTLHFVRRTISSSLSSSSSSSPLSPPPSFTTMSSLELSNSRTLPVE